jgi:hypothetical protein
VVSALNSAEVPYMLTGSYASSLHSIPRATRDIDIIIFPDRDQLTKLVKLLSEPVYYSDFEDAIDALKHRSQFNVIDRATGWKVDFIIPPFDEFNMEEFERRMSVDVGGTRLSVVSPEDIVVAKLRWAKLGESERQLEDAATVLRAQTSLNIGYIETWVRKLGLETQWHAARARAG